MAARDTKPRSGRSPAEREPGVRGRRGYKLPTIEPADDPQPSSASIRTKEEYEASERARVDKAKASSARSKAATRKARSSTRKARRDSFGSAVDSITPKALSRAPKNALRAELLAAVVLITLEAVAGGVDPDGNPVAGKAPGIQSYVGVFVVYLVLAFAAEAGEQAARTSAGLGGLVLLAIGMRAAAALTKGGAVVATAGTPVTTGAPPRQVIRKFQGGKPMVTSLGNPERTSSLHLSIRKAV